MNLDNPSPGELKYKGVRKRKWGKWVSEIRLPHSRERIWLGSYDTPEKAARAFDAAQFCLRGPAANFNFPDNPPDIAGGQGLSPAEIQLAAARFANEDQPSPAEPIPLATAVEENYAPSCSGSASVAAQWDSDDVCLESEAGPFYGYDNNNNNDNYDFSQLDRMGSGFNYEAEFGLVSPGSGGFYGSQQPDDSDYGYDNWNNSGSEGSFLWNF